MLCTFDEAQVLLPEGASPDYRFWEQEVYAFDDVAGVRFAFGLRPEQAAAHWTADVGSRLDDLLKLPKALAVGVTGLDFESVESAAAAAGDGAKAAKQAQVGLAGGIQAWFIKVNVFFLPSCLAIIVPSVPHSTRWRRCWLSSNWLGNTKRWWWQA
jgi:hypothetical protein